MLCNITMSNGSKIKIEVNSIPYEQAYLITACAQDAFREVEMINAETGEVFYTRYVSSTIFQPVCSITKVVEFINSFSVEEV